MKREDKNKKKKPSNGTKTKRISARAIQHAEVVLTEKEQENNNHQLITRQQLINEDDIHSSISRGLYTDEILPLLEKYCKAGLNNKQIATSLGIGEKTFYEWRRDKPQFAQSLKKYRGVTDIMVENALFKSAVGFEFQETTLERRRTGKDEQGQWIYEMVPTVITNKHIPGNAISQIFYLKNRMPERYKDKVETMISLPQDISQIAFAIKRREE